jgi:hypothetical protein
MDGREDRGGSDPSMKRLSHRDDLIGWIPLCSGLILATDLASAADVADILRWVAIKALRFAPMNALKYARP